MWTPQAPLKPSLGKSSLNLGCDVMLSGSSLCVSGCIKASTTPSAWRKDRFRRVTGVIEMVVQYRHSYTRKCSVYRTELHGANSSNRKRANERFPRCSCASEVSISPHIHVQSSPSLSRDSPFLSIRSTALSSGCRPSLELSYGRAGRCSRRITRPSLSSATDKGSMLSGTTQSPSSATSLTSTSVSSLLEKTSSVTLV